MVETKFLSKAEEVECGRKIQAMLRAKDSLGSDGLSRVERNRANRVVEEGKQAMRVLAENNMRLVYKYANSFKSRYPVGIDIDDIVQEGMVGLVKAMLKYDPQRNNKFSTMATNWIFQSINRNCSDSVHTIHVPEARMVQFSKIDKIVNSRADACGERKAMDLAKRKFGMSREVFNAVANASRACLSLDVPVEDSDSCFVPLEVVDYSTPEKAYIDTEDYRVFESAKKSLRDALGELTPMQRDIIFSRYLKDGKAATLRDLSEKYDTSAYFIKKEEEIALGVLRERVSVG